MCFFSNAEACIAYHDVWLDNDVDEASYLWKWRILESIMEIKATEKKGKGKEGKKKWMDGTGKPLDPHD